VALPNPVARAAALSGVWSAAPLRLVGQLADPVRGDLARNMRRAVGVTAEPVPPTMDPALSYLPPAGVARLVHADLPTMLIGGLSALLLQTLHPLAMAGVAEHSNYQDDPLGRLRRTAAFVGTTTFGSAAGAQRAIDQVRRVHRRVTGIAPDGRPYSAGDPDLVTFIHVAEVSSFLESARRFGPRPLSPAQCDRYYDEVAPVAVALGADWVPRTEERAVYAVLLSAAVSTLPRWARRELGLSAPASLDLLLHTVAVIPLARAVSAGLRWVVAPQVASDRPPSMATT